MARTKAHPRPPFPAQHQAKPGLESNIRPRPRYKAPEYRGAGKLDGLAALITGGDSGIGRAVAVLFAREGADVAIVYLPVEESDAQTTQAAVEAEGRRALLIPGDVQRVGILCRGRGSAPSTQFGRLDILVNNAAYQQHQKSIEDITDEQFDRTFRTNIYGYFYMARAALPHLKPGSAIINTGSITGLEGSKPAARLQRHQGRHPRLHEVAGPEPGRPQDSRQLRLAGSGVDAAEPVGQAGREGREIRRGYADETAGATRRDRAGLRVLRLERRLQLHHRRGPHAAGW